MSSESISKEHARGFVAAWLGWAFDGLDGVLYTLVALPFVTHLMGAALPTPEAKDKAALIQAFFMFGWAAGGLFFGRIGDRLGRTRTLTLTILLYSAFTGLSAFAVNWQMLLVFRFVAALGIGGEWAAGSALVAEILPSKHRSWASALLQTGYQVGMILATLTVAGLPRILAQQGISVSDSQRWVFLVGILPGLVTLWIRKAVPEPEAWAGARSQETMPKVADLFAPAVRGTTLRVLGLCSIALTTVWTLIYFNTQILRTHPEVKGMAPLAVEALIQQVTVAYLLWNIVGNFAATYLAEKIGVKATFAGFMAVAMAACLWGFGVPHALAGTIVAIDVFAFFGLGLFGIFPLYIPPLFPVLLRTTGAGFCYNMGRVVAGVGTLFGAAIVTRYGPTMPIAFVGILYIPGIVLSFTMPHMANAEEKPSAHSGTV